MSQIYFRIPQAEALAQRLVAASFADLVFLQILLPKPWNARIKTARKYHAVNGAPGTISINYL